MRSIFINGKENRRSLGHKDRKLAEKQTYELLAQLAADEEAVEQGTLTLAQLHQLYLESPSFADKKDRTQKEDARRIERVVHFFGAGRKVDTLTESDVRRFTAARRKGDPRLQGIRPGVAVRDRSVEADLVALHTMLNWGAKERDHHGKRLIVENPLHGIPIPREKNPVRPLVSHDEYLRLLAVAEQVNPLLSLALVVAEGTGRRLSAFRQLRWSDINLEAGTIHWRAEYDKKGYAGVVPMADEVRMVLVEVQREYGTIGDLPVFPSPKDSSKPCGRHLLQSWLERAYILADLEPKAGGTWHPFRRKWATERKGLSPVDVAAAGGWKNPNTPLRIYQQADAVTMREVVSKPSHRLASGA
jgi:integrase